MESQPQGDSTIEDWCLVTGPFGLLLGCIVTLPLLIHSCKKYCDLFQQDEQIHLSKLADHSKRQRRVYLLLISYLTCSFLTCITWAFIRNNTFTFQPFTELQCAIGFYLGYGIWSSSKILMYIIFLYRLKMVFHRSVYQYSDCFYNTMYSYIFILPYGGFITFVTLNSMLQDHWILKHNPYTSQVWCTSDGQSYDHFTAKAILGAFALSEWIGSFILLGMFTHGLKGIQAQIMEQNILSMKIEHDMVDSKQRESDLNVSVHGETDGNDVENTKKIEIADLEKGRGGDRKGSHHSDMNSGDLRFIIELHDLIKRQTILVCIAVISSLCFWGLNLIDKGFSVQLGWDISINVICVWMTLKSSRKYYDICSRYGVCCVCYRNKV